MVSNFREKAGEVQQEAATPESTTGRGGKSSNTAFEKTTLYLEKDIKLRAQRGASQNFGVGLGKAA